MHAKKQKYIKYNKEKMNYNKNQPRNDPYDRIIDKDIIITIFYMFQKLVEIFNMLQMGKNFLSPN